MGDYGLEDVLQRSFTPMPAAPFLIFIAAFTRMRAEHDPRHQVLPRSGERGDAEQPSHVGPVPTGQRQAQSAGNRR